MNHIDLINSAREAMSYAYAIYSNFKVGAAVLTKSGKVFQGCNIENAAYPACICAERTALFKAVSEGEKEFTHLAIASSRSDYDVFPCGICRQVMAELMPLGEVVIFDKNGQIKVYTVKELLPHMFDKAVLKMP